MPRARSERAPTCPRGAYRQAVAWYAGASPGEAPRERHGEHHRAGRRPRGPRLRGATPPSRWRSSSTRGPAGRAIAPSGASTGIHEAVELRDGGDRFGGKGVLRAVANVNGEIADALAGLDALDQRAVDLRPDRPRRHAGQEPARRQRHRGHLAGRGQGGGRRARAPPLPGHRRGQRPRAAGARCSTCSTAEPTPATPSTSRSSCSCRWGRPRSARRCAGARRPTTPCATCCPSGASPPAVGDEGGFAPDLPSNEEAVAVLLEAIEAAGRVPGEEIAIALDPATSELWQDGAYVLAGEGRTLTPGRAGRLLGRPGRPVPDRLHRGRHGRGGLGRLGGPHRRAGRPGAAGGRRRLRHQRRADRAGHRRWAWPTPC